jgi:hypothetical protein
VNLAEVANFESLQWEFPHSFARNGRPRSEIALLAQEIARQVRRARGNSELLKETKGFHQHQ